MSWSLCDKKREKLAKRTMRAEDIKEYCLSKHKAYETFPFGEVPICYKLNGKIFAQLYPYESDYKITLKCAADVVFFFFCPRGTNPEGSHTALRYLRREEQKSSDSTKWNELQKPTSSNISLNTISTEFQLHLVWCFLRK